MRLTARGSSCCKQFRAGKPIDLVIKIYTNKRMLVRVYLDSKWAYSTSKSGTSCGKAEKAALKNCSMGVPQGAARGNSWGQFFQAPLKLLHSTSDFVSPIGQSGTFKTLKGPKQKPKWTSGSPKGTTWGNCEYTMRQSVRLNPRLPIWRLENYISW